MDDMKICGASASIGLVGHVLSRSLMFLVVTVVFCTAVVTGEEAPKQSLEFRWKFIKVGVMDFEIGPAFFAEAAANAGEFGQPLFAQTVKSLSPNEGVGVPVHLAVTGITDGPLKWFKNYQARAQLTVQGRLRTFVLAGEDSGVYEQRALVFEAGFPPVVESFNDSNALAPLEVQRAWKLDTVDPLTVFEWMIFSVVQGQSCAHDFWIYDGKRRYFARTKDLAEQPSGKTFEENRAGRCRLTLVGSKANKADHKESGEDADMLVQGIDVEITEIVDDVGGADTNLRGQGAAAEKKGWGSFWPFGKGDRHIDFEFRVCSTERVIVERVEMGAPLGKVVGASKDQC